MELAHRQQERQLADVDTASRKGDAELRTKVTDVATGSIRAQMFGLFLVGLGTIVSFWA